MEGSDDVFFKELSALCRQVDCGVAPVDIIQDLLYYDLSENQITRMSDALELQMEVEFIKALIKAMGKVEKENKAGEKMPGEQLELYPSMNRMVAILATQLRSEKQCGKWNWKQHQGG